jgi:hypothetical protein
VGTLCWQRRRMTSGAGPVSGVVPSAEWFVSSLVGGDDGELLVDQLQKQQWLRRGSGRRRTVVVQPGWRHRGTGRRPAGAVGTLVGSDVGGPVGSVAGGAVGEWFVSSALNGRRRRAGRITLWHSSGLRRVATSEDPSGPAAVGVVGGLVGGPQ